MKTAYLLTISVIFALLLPQIAVAQSPVPLTDVIQINSLTLGDQAHPAVAVLPDGSLFFVWESDRSPGNDTSKTSILGRHFLADGTPTGPEFQVNTVISSYQRFPDVTVLEDGTFVVAWTGKNRVRAQRFRLTSRPIPVGRETVLNSAEVIPYAVALTPTSDGGFYAMWQDETDPIPPFFADGFSVRRFDARLRPAGELFFVDGFNRLSPKPQMVVIPKKEDLVVSWRDAFVRVDPNGDPVYSPQDLSTNSISGIGVNRHGNLLIAGDSITDPGVGSGYRESTRYAQVFGSDGTPRRAAKRIDPTAGFLAGGSAESTIVVPWTEHGFLVAWDSQHGGLRGRQIGPRGRLISKFDIADKGFHTDGAADGETAVFTFVQNNGGLEIFARIFAAESQ